MKTFVRLATGCMLVLLVLLGMYFGSYVVLGRHTYRLADPPHNKVRVFRSSQSESFFTVAAKLEGLLTGQRVFTHADERVEDYQ